MPLRHGVWNMGLIATNQFNKSFPEIIIKSIMPILTMPVLISRGAVNSWIFKRPQLAEVLGLEEKRNQGLRKERRGLCKFCV